MIYITTPLCYLKNLSQAKPQLSGNVNNFYHGVISLCKISCLSNTRFKTSFSFQQVKCFLHSNINLQIYSTFFNNRIEHLVFSQQVCKTWSTTYPVSSLLCFSLNVLRTIIKKFTSHCEINIFQNFKFIIMLSEKKTTSQNNNFN